MAQITNTIDDLTGESLPVDTPTTTVRINDPRWADLTGLPGSFSLDLSDASFKRLLKALELFAKKATPLTTSTTRTTTDEDARRFAAAARQWAIATNLQPSVSERGAVPQRALDAYREHLKHEAEQGRGGPNDTHADTAE